ncbi:NIPSNAP family protein [Luteimonas sp. SJ-92]|uniref:NIPSNAP family protein n=1 Tax=Luteimonas salinisoli TaxID=2752307 RepID=A0A853JAH6_9GAMM|nr:NIPSNAP family protein [Luteimonas salinisoli]NZA26226.1 NIPSNAP family protein [Luteimonas salinisoli]
MIVEIRTYRLKPGMRDGFLAFFRTEAIPLQRSLGIRVAGPFVDIDDPDRVVWARAFPSFAERERMKAELYEGDTWIRELEGIVMPMLERYDSILTETPEWFIDELLACERS